MIANRTDMQDKHCGDCCDIQAILFTLASSFVVSFVLAFNEVKIVAITTIRVLHVGVIRHHVPRH